METMGFREGGCLRSGGFIACQCERNLRLRYRHKVLKIEMDFLYRKRYNRLMKPVSFIGNSLDEMRSFPEGARREVGFQIDRLQRGLDPDDWKPMKLSAQGREKSGCEMPPVPIG